jgi:hypothetical protein
MLSYMTVLLAQTDGIEVYTTSVTGFINKCIDYVVVAWDCKPLDYKGKHSRKLPSDMNLPDELNYFYARFEVSNT